MQIRDVHLLSPFFRNVSDLQKKSFPEHEQYPLPLLMLLSVRKNTNFKCFLSGKEVYGIMYYVEDRFSIYLLYLAVPEAMRKDGIGSKMISWLKEQAGSRKIYLNIDGEGSDNPSHGNTEGRIRFYERHGILDTGCRMLDSSGSYHIFSSGGKLDPKQYYRIINRLGMWVYRPVIYTTETEIIA